MSIFKTPNSIFHALVLAAGFGASSAIALTAAAIDASAPSEAFVMADSNGDNGLDRDEFPVYISLKSGTGTAISLVSSATSYEIPFTNKDKNNDGVLDAQELNKVERDIPHWDAAQVEPQETAPEPETTETAPVIEEPVLDEPVLDAPEMEAPMIEAPEVPETVLDAPVETTEDELMVEPLEEGTPDETELEDFLDELDDLDATEPQPEG